MGMRPRNRDGTPVDPVPLLVVVLTAFLITHAWGPLYLGALGVPMIPAFTILTGLFLVIVAVAYHQLVWTAHPERQGEVPAERRFARLVYAIVIGIGLVVLLALPFLVGDF